MISSAFKRAKTMKAAARGVTARDDDSASDSEEEFHTPARAPEDETAPDADDSMSEDGEDVEEAEEAEEDASGDEDADEEADADEDDDEDDKDGEVDGDEDPEDGGSDDDQPKPAARKRTGATVKYGSSKFDRTTVRRVLERGIHTAATAGAVATGATEEADQPRFIVPPSSVVTVIPLARCILRRLVKASGAAMLEYRQSMLMKKHVLRGIATDPVLQALLSGGLVPGVSLFGENTSTYTTGLAPSPRKASAVRARTAVKSYDAARGEHGDDSSSLVDAFVDDMETAMSAEDTDDVRATVHVLPPTADVTNEIGLARYVGAFVPGMKQTHPHVFAAVTAETYPLWGSSDYEPDIAPGRLAEWSAFMAALGAACLAGTEPQHAGVDAGGAV